MEPVTSILLPVDYSDRSLDAARQAEALARQFQSAVTVLHVADPQEAEFGRFEPGGLKIRELERLLGNEFTGSTVSRIESHGEPAQEIVRFAASNHVDLIVMAGHTYRPIESFLAGSVAAEVLRNAKCPVWMPAQAEPGLPPMFREVLCSVDLGPETQRVVDWASQFATAFRARLSILHVFQSLEPGQPPEQPAEWLSQTERNELDRVIRKLNGTGRVVFDGGDIPEAICKQALKARADLLAIGRSPKEGDVGAGRTKVRTIMSKAPCPVVRV